MQSFALWYEKRKSDPACEVEAKLNFNLWTECGWKKNPTYLDIGILLSNFSNVKQLNLFVPFPATEKNVEDLGDSFKSAELSSAIFNENLAPSSECGGKQISIENKDNGKRFNVYIIDIQNDLCFSEFENPPTGTIISINLEKKENSISIKEDIYFRFRIKGLKFDELVHKYSTDKNGLQSVFNTTYTIDFRYFNKRSLPKSILEKINKDTIITISSLHFLVITKTHVNLITNDCQGRKLEETIWDNYVGQPTSDLIAYHFKKKFNETKNVIQENSWKSKEGACEFFIKYCVEKSVLIKYIIFTILLGFIGSLFCTLFCHFVFPAW